MDYEPLVPEAYRGLDTAKFRAKPRSLVWYSGVAKV